MKIMTITPQDLRDLSSKIKEANQMPEGQDKSIKFLTLTTWCEGVANIMEREEAGRFDHYPSLESEVL